MVGERWALLIVREALRGSTRFSEFQDGLQVSTDILASRLETLVTAGILERRPYQEAGRRSRHSYHLTPVGGDLVPALMALMQFGDAHLAGEDGPPLLLRHRETGSAVRVAFVDADGQQIDQDDVESVPGPGATPVSAA